MLSGNCAAELELGVVEMNQLMALLEAIPDGEALHVGLGKQEFILSDFEAVDESIYGRGDVVLANVVRVVSGSQAITQKNKIEFDLAQVTFVRNVDGSKIIYAK